MGSYCSIRTVTVPPPSHQGNIPTPIISSLPTEKHFHTHANRVEHRAVKITPLKSARFTFFNYKQSPCSFPQNHSSVTQSYCKHRTQARRLSVWQLKFLNKVGNEWPGAVNESWYTPPQLSGLVCLQALWRHSQRISVWASKLKFPSLGLCFRLTSSF